jgi:23S rRNA (adenine2030-N6)-methyltransferase
LNYRHIYHAGNFADVFKHSVLALILKLLAAKDKPFCYIETHAGAGRYDLESEAAKKSGEWRDGIARLWEGEPIPEATDYLAAVRALNHDGLRYYPGSPRVAAQLLRAQDRMVLCELVPDEAERLARDFASDQRIVVRAQDGYPALKALLPPTERRGLVLFDPPYESAAEFAQALAALKAAHARWPTGVYALWYPIKERAATARFERDLAASGIRKTLIAELGAYPADSAFRLNGSGLAIVNPPFGLEAGLKRLIPWLHERLSRAAGSGWRAEWLVPE